MRSNGKEEFEKLSGRVLVADDDPQFRDLLVRRAKKMGLSVLEVEDGNEAMEAVEAERFDLIISDLYMPGHTGLEVIQKAQEEDPEIHAIILTASATVETAIEALRSGVYDYLTKPLESLADFEITVSRALEHANLIRENERLFKEVQRLAVTDGLTGLFNRHKLDEALANEFERARRYKRPLSVVMIDMDGLKTINDTYGHPAGDAALKLVADVIRSQIRRVDMPARFGGDEFVVLLPEVELELAVKIAERICTKIRPSEGHEDMFTVSGGVAQLSDEHASTEDFLRSVDDALYRAKRAGGQQVMMQVLDKVEILEGS
ncbi:MAG: diguanylate cyclase [Anaerolineales bacterium]